MKVTVLIRALAKVKNKHTTLYFSLIDRRGNSNNWIALTLVDLSRIELIRLLKE